jgi:hypothetical protein
MQYFFLRALLPECRFFRLLERGKQACYGGKKSNPFHQGRSQDHVGTNVIRSFWLTGDAFNGTLTDQTDTNTGTDSSKTCTDSTVTGLNHIRQQSHHHRHNICFL